MSKTVLFQAIQFSINTHFSSIWLLTRTLSGATTPGQSRPGSDGNEGVLSIPQSSRTPVEGLTPLQRCSWCILQLQPTGKDLTCIYSQIFFNLKFLFHNVLSLELIIITELLGLIKEETMLKSKNSLSKINAFFFSLWKYGFIEISKKMSTAYVNVNKRQLQRWVEKFDTSCIKKGCSGHDFKLHPLVRLLF